MCKTLWSFSILRKSATPGPSTLASKTSLSGIYLTQVPIQLNQHKCKELKRLGAVETQGLVLVGAANRYWMAGRLKRHGLVAAPFTIRQLKHCQTC